MQRPSSASSSDSSAFIDALSIMEYPGPVPYETLSSPMDSTDSHNHEDEHVDIFHNTIMGENEGEIPIRLPHISLRTSKSSVDYPTPFLRHIRMIPRTPSPIMEIPIDSQRLEKLARVLFPGLYLKRDKEQFRKDWLDLMDCCESNVRRSFSKGVGMNVNDFVDEVRRMMRYGLMDLHRTLVSFIHNRRFDTDLRTYHEEHDPPALRNLGSPIESTYPALRWMKEMFGKLLDIHGYAPLGSSEELTFLMILRNQVQAFSGMVQYGTQLRTNSQTVRRLSVNPFSPHFFHRNKTDKSSKNDQATSTSGDLEIQASQSAENDEAKLRFIDKFGLPALKNHPCLEFNFSPDISLGRHLNLSSRKHRSNTTLELYTGTSPIWRLYLVHSSPLHAYDQIIGQICQISYSYLWTLQILFPTDESQKWAVSQGICKSYLDASRLYPPESTSCSLFVNRMQRLENIGYNQWARLRLELKRASLEQPLHYWFFWLLVLFIVVGILCLLFLVSLFSVIVARL
ncbi:hypothetical protein NEOLI_000891 [Neolecta irregularis DAH-3]|uniref:Uncharacterized protein n=1 Tax=Neolecta irregularis (strain DAH-3) TaxID=1198029 RepID=A0A1U7LUI1_NEOID|nr:hypothetical protein NEOLI_000891 [Neolecta irregularis DAH-3]|eukprot:OLL26335.1 hypothetical protein NEOLI_000891 [Neolecta irregularis DAH-3]